MTDTADEPRSPDPGGPPIMGPEHMGTVVEAAGLATWLWDVGSGAVAFNGNWAAMLGLDPAEVEPHERIWHRLVHPDDRERVVGIMAAHLDGRTDSYVSQHRLRHRGGRWIWVLDRGRVVERAADGRAILAAGSTLDITAWRESEQALRESEGRFRSFIDHSSSYIYAKDLAGRYILANATYLRLFGYSDESQLLGLTDSDRFGREVDWTLNDRRVAQTGEALETEESAEFADGLRTYISAKFPLRDASGRIVAVGGISTDITARKRAEEAPTLLMREVDHRAKNVLSAVQALVALTSAPSLDQYREVLLGRIAALGRAHSFLTANRWSGADLKQLATEELAAWAGRLTVSGPSVELAPNVVQPLAMALHELATNAAKYGALSAARGRVEVSWRLERPWVHMEWRERDGPPVAPPTRRGLGMELLALGIESQAEGMVSLDWRPTGLVCTLTLPLRGGGGD